MQPKTSRSFTFSGTSLVITGFSPKTVIIRIVASDTCHLEFGDNPVATLDSMLLPVGVVEYFYLNEGQSIAVIQHDSSGILYISEMS